MVDALRFVDLQAQRRRLSGQVERAIDRVLDHGNFIMGPEVTELESRLATYSGAHHVVTCSSGTDALFLPLLAWGVGPGDAVFVPAFTFAATAEVVSLTGAVPVFVDVDEQTYNIDSISLAKAILYIGHQGLRPVGVITVDLFGQPVNYHDVSAVAREHGLWLMADAAQSFGASIDGRRTGTFGDVTATSFFPAKPLGCYGDGGAIFTDDEDLASRLRSLREHGKGPTKYENVRIGVNGRLDTIQAAILLEKLSIYDEELAARQRVAAAYAAGLATAAKVPKAPAGIISAWAQYTIAIKDRTSVATSLEARGIPTAVYYPRPLHEQGAYHHCPRSPDGLVVASALATRVLSLPMHPYLDDASVSRVIDAVIDATSAVVS
jgi:dTDP-4-amino-4,6-dideoxygalactose transaminase